jgi:hypothetical protein
MPTRYTCSRVYVYWCLHVRNVDSTAHNKQINPKPLCKLVSLCTSFPTPFCCTLNFFVDHVGYHFCLCETIRRVFLSVLTMANSGTNQILYIRQADRSLLVRLDNSNNGNHLLLQNTFAPFPLVCPRHASTAVITI